ncbi:MAG: hypothetical protein V4642_03555 [Bacteroidota bacterium]
MKELAEIVKLVTFARITPIENISHSGISGKMLALYTAILEGKVRTDNEAAALIYGSAASDKKYKMLRKRLTEYLLQIVVQYDFSKPLPQLAVAKDKCDRDIFAIKKLLALGFYDTGVLLTEKLLKEARLWDYTEIEIACLKILRESAALDGDDQKYKEYATALQAMILRFAAEDRAEEYCQLLESQLTPAATENAIAEKAANYLEDIAESLTQTPSDTLWMYYFRIKLLLMQLRHQYNDGLDVCRDAKAHLRRNHRFSTATRRTEFTVGKMNCWLALKSYKEVIWQGKECLTMYRSGGHNWHATQEIIFLAAMHSNNFEKAYEAYEAVVKHENHDILPDILREKWMIFGAYLWVAFHLPGENSVQLRENLLKTTDLRRIWQNTDAIGKEKAGLNAALQIARLFCCIVENDKRQYIQRLKLLKQYTKRNFTDDTHHRLLLFVKLLRAPGEDHEEDMSIYNELQENPLTMEQFIEGMEVLPYEMLWQRVLKVHNESDIKKTFKNLYLQSQTVE